MKAEPYKNMTVAELEELIFTCNARINELCRKFNNETGLEVLAIQGYNDPNDPIGKVTTFEIQIKKIL